MFKKIVAKATVKEDNSKVFYVTHTMNINKQLLYDLCILEHVIDFRFKFLFASKKNIKIGLEKRFPEYNIEFVKVGRWIYENAKW